MSVSFLQVSVFKFLVMQCLYSQFVLKKFSRNGGLVSFSKARETGVGCEL